jgi:predicted nucleotidyltransferase
MIFPHQQKAIDYIVKKFSTDQQVDALMIYGSIAHGFNTENSDVDIAIVISDTLYEQRKKENNITYWESLSQFYNGGYIDGKYITLDYLKLVAEKGNDPTKFAFHDAIVKFDKTNKVQELLEDISIFPIEKKQDRAIKFVSQLLVWKWYSEEAINKKDKYLLDLSVSKLILFGGRLILLHNCMFFPYHKWFLKLLENAPNKPDFLMMIIDKLLINKSTENINEFYNTINNYYDFAEGQEYNCLFHFIKDVEHNWMYNNEFIENI